MLARQPNTANVDDIVDEVQQNVAIAILKDIEKRAADGRPPADTSDRYYLVRFKSALIDFYRQRGYFREQQWLIDFVGDHLLARDLFKLYCQQDESPERTVTLLKRNTEDGGGRSYTVDEDLIQRAIVEMNRRGECDRLNRQWIQLDHPAEGEDGESPGFSLASEEPGPESYLQQEQQEIIKSILAKRRDHTSVKFEAIRQKFLADDVLSDYEKHLIRVQYSSAEPLNARQAAKIADVAYHSFNRHIKKALSKIRRWLEDNNLD